MKELYNEFFYIPKHGKIREKVMLARVAAIIAIMIMCLAAMSLTAYAYFSYNVTSGSNIIKAANFETEVSIQITDADGKAVENNNITPITSDHKNFRIEGLEVGKWYNITIKPTDRSTAQTGFIIVSVDKGCNVTYHTQQLGVDENVEGGKTPEIRFKLMITDATNVILESHWGTSSHYDAYKNKGNNEELYITQDEKIKMIVNGKDINEGDDGNTGDKNVGGTPPTDTSNPPATEGTTPPTERTTPSEQTTPPETTGTSEPTSTTEPSSSITDPATTQSAQSTGWEYTLSAF